MDSDYDDFVHARDIPTDSQYIRQALGDIALAIREQTEAIKAQTIVHENTYNLIQEKHDLDRIRRGEDY